MPESADIGAPPVIAAAGNAQTAAREQVIDPWSVSAAVDENGNTLQFDYAAISQHVLPFIPPFTTPP